jgi:pSer/pThr/pTyr-binding forkhead associated (FHA) protein
MQNTLYTYIHTNSLLVNPHTGQEFDLNNLSTSIGRAQNNDVILSSDKSASRFHAIISYMNDRYYIEDLGSTNGTYINGQTIEKRTALSSGDEIRFGVTRLLFLTIPNRRGISQNESFSANEKTTSTAVENFVQMRLSARLNPAF